MGDQIALFEQGGVVAQFTTPQELLRHPANQHVADFVGRDRGFRALSFASLDLDEDELDLIECEPVVLGAGDLSPSDSRGTSAEAGNSSSSGWCVVVDEGGSFLGWSNDAAAVTAGDSAAIRTGVGVIRPDFTLRDALDAMLSSPEGRAVSLSEESVPLGLVSLDHLLRAGLLEQHGADAQNRDVTVVTGDYAEEHDLVTVADLEPLQDEITLGGSPESVDRRAGLAGIKELYGIEFADFMPIDKGGPITVAALNGGDVQVAQMFSTQPAIVENGYVVLEDPMDLSSAENVTPLVLASILTPELEDVINSVTESLTTETLMHLNSLVEVDKQDPQKVAKDYVESLDL